MNRHSRTLTRRSLIAGSLATTAATRIASAQTPQLTQITEGTQYLVTAVAPSGDPEILTGIEAYDAGLNKLSAMPISDGVVNFDQTGRSGVIHVMTLFGGLMVDVAKGDVVTIHWDTTDPGYLFPAKPDEGKGYSERYLMAQPLEMDKILLVNLETFEGTDITGHVANESTDAIAMVPDLPVTGSLGGLWTGDHVYTLDLENPESAEALVGDDPDWYSTTLQLSHDGKWGTFTTYDPQGSGQDARCYLQNLETGDFTKIMDGHAWTTGFFIPNDPAHFVANAPDSGLEYRSIETPDESGEVIAEVEEEGSRVYWLAEGNVLLYGHRTNNDAPRNWLRIDMETREVTELPELEGQRPWWPQLSRTQPKHLLFCEDTYDNVTHTLRGFDVETGEVWVAVEDVYIEVIDGVSASRDGTWYTASTPNRGTNIGVWLIDMVNRTSHKLEEGDGLYAEYGAVSPDGQTLAVTYLEQPDGVRYTTTSSTGSPEDTSKLTDAHVLGWTL